VLELNFLCCAMSALDVVVPRLKALLREDAPPIPPHQFKNPAFAKQIADMIGLDESSQRMLTAAGGAGALGLFMYEAFCKAQSELSKGVDEARVDSKAAAMKKAKESNAKAASEEFLSTWNLTASLHDDAAYDKMSEELVRVDKVLLSLLKKHLKSDPKWPCIAKELEQATGAKKSAQWCKRRAKMLALAHTKAADEGEPSAGSACVEGAAGSNTEALLDQHAGELAFEETMELITEQLPQLLPIRHPMDMGGASDAVLWMLRSAEGFETQSVFFRGIAIQTIRAEDDAGAALLEVSAYLESQPESRQALCELQALVCVLVGLQMTGNVNMISELVAIKQAVELFAWGFLLSDTAFALFLNKQGHGSTTAPGVFAVFEGMQRCSSKVLRDEPKHFPSLLVQSRLQRGDDKAKLEFQKGCVAALELHINAEWVPWKARVHEMIGLTYGGMGDFPAAVGAYQLALMSSKRRSTMFLQAQCFHSMREFQNADRLLNEYLTAVADKAAFDDYLFPNALYLKGGICLGLKDLGGAHSYYRQAKAAETSRCLFYESVDSAAKRSLDRVCRVAFGDDLAQRAALKEFVAAFQSARSTQDMDPAKDHAVNLGDVSADDLISQTPDKSTSSESAQLRVHIIAFSRHPASLRNALLNGDDLVACRTALQNHGINPELPCGAKVFSHPDDFNFVLSALEDQELMPWHVVVTGEFLDAVHSAVDSLKSKDQVRQKSDIRVDASARICQTCDKPGAKYRCTKCKVTYYCSLQCQKMDYAGHVKTCSIESGLPTIVSRTFLDIKVPKLAGRTTVTKSTTDADPRKGRNPRGV